MTTERNNDFTSPALEASRILAPVNSFSNMLKAIDDEIFHNVYDVLETCLCETERRLIEKLEEVEKGETSKAM